MTLSDPAPSPDYYYPNKMSRIVLLAMEEVMGRNGVNAVLNVARLRHLVNNYPANNFDKQVTFRELSALMRALDEMYGPRGGRGLALRAGRAAFKYGIKEFGPVLGIADLAFRLLPLNMKLKVGADVFAEVFNRFSDQTVRVVDEEERIIWQNLRCPMCWERQAEAPCCHLAVGILQEALYWVSGGKHFDVTETTCCAAGGENCTIIIDKKPMD
ncbi:MAG: 4-vinyl reductase [Anaerolineales bacterium]|nr:4-vinyl reductase [Anaerolineales bacterium]